LKTEDWFCNAIRGRKRLFCNEKTENYDVSPTYFITCV
jgi:hypothetical protein